MENFEAKFIQPKNQEEEKKTAEIPRAEIVSGQLPQEEDVDNAKQIEIIQRKIDDQNKIEEIREQLGIESNDTKIQSFISELPNKEGFIDFGQLQRVGHGGTHDVFIYPQNPTFVIKLNRGALEKARSIGQAELPPEVRKMADEYVEGENSKNEQLYKHFGQEHCLREKVMVQKIIVEQEGVSQNIEGVVSIQEASDIFKDPNKKDFSAGYTEQDPSVEENRGVYDKMNKALLGGGEFDEKDFLKFNEKLKPIFELADRDKEFADCAREFLLRFKEYFEASGKFIDLVGQENVLFHQQDGKWTFKLGSVVKGENKQVMEEAMSALEENPEILNQDEKMRNQLMNQLTLIRLLNATGQKVSIGKIIDIKLTERQLENLDKVKFKKEVEVEGEIQKSPIRELLDNNPELAKIYNERSKTHEIVVNESGQILSDGQTYENNPKMRALVELADAIRKGLPDVQVGYVRLWRGNRPDEVGHNPSYTNSLEGIALPFLRGYNGVLSYIDVPQEEAKKYLTSGAKDSEFILPSEVVRNAKIVGFTLEEADEIKKKARPLSEIEQGNGWTMVD